MDSPSLTACRPRKVGAADSAWSVCITRGVVDNPVPNDKGYGTPRCIQQNGPTTLHVRPSYTGYAMPSDLLVRVVFTEYWDPICATRPGRFWLSWFSLAGPSGSGIKVGKRRAGIARQHHLQPPDAVMRRNNLEYLTASTNVWIIPKLEQTYHDHVRTLPLVCTTW
jgi:hypothetical protein